MKKSLIISAIITLIALIMVTTNVNASNIEDLQAKIDNAQTNSTVLLDDNYDGDIVIGEGKNITINLNGKNITSKNSDTITVELGATLTIEGQGEIISNNGKAAIFNNGTTVVNSGTIRKSDKNYYNIANHGKMTINGGTIINETEYDGKSHASLVENGYYDYVNKSSRNGYVSGVNQANPSLIINGGTFNGGLNTIKNDEGATLTINNGIFKNQIQLAVMNWNIATINNGTFDVPKGLDKTTLFNGKYHDAYGVGKLTINGGIFNADYLLETNNYSTNETTIITAGTFNTKIGIVNPIDSNGAKRPEMKLTIKGGTFNQEPEKNDIVKGYIVEKQTDNKYKVKLNEVSSDISTGNSDTKIEITEETQNKIDEILNKELEKNEEVKKALEEGKQVKVEIIINDLKQDNISEEEQKKLTDSIQNEKIAKYFDISLVIKIDNEVAGKISEPSEKLSFALTIEDELIKEGRVFYILRIHDGKVEKISTTISGNKLEFETDKFSTYALVYEDKAQTETDNKENQEEKDNTPKTGAMNIALYTCIALGTVALIGTVKTKNSKH